MGTAKPGDKRGRLVVVDTAGEDDEIVLNCRCDCGVRVALTPTEFRRRSKCAPHSEGALWRCRLDPIPPPRRGKPYRTKAADFVRDGHPGVTAVGTTTADAVAERRQRLGLESFADDPVTRFLVVFADGSRLVADTFDDAKILYRSPDLDHTFGTTFGLAA